MVAYALDHYRPQPSWYRHNPYGIHGLGHAARVLVWAEQVGQDLAERGVAPDIEVIRWASAIHDVGRVDDWRDKPHGQRSADWAQAHKDLFGSTLSADRLAKLVYVCVWHVPADIDAPILTPELTCLKDADGLDRVRIRDLNPRLLRTDRARALCEDAQELFRLSCRQTGDPWESVRACAISMGLWH
jgi:hypothetical protein